MGFEPASPPTNVDEPNADAFAKRMEEIQEILRNNMRMAQADHERHANRHRGTARQYKEGDLVWLDKEISSPSAPAGSWRIDVEDLTQSKNSSAPTL